MKRSITTCLIVCGAMFLVEFGTELAVQPNSSLSHLVGVMSAQSVVGDEEKPEDPRPERKLPHPSQEWVIQLDKISAAIDEEDYESAREMLDRQVQRTRRWNERELAIFHQRYLDLALVTEDFKLAIEQAGKILEYAEHVSYFTEERVLWIIATIYASDEYQDFDKALEYIQRWLDLKLDWEEGSRQYAFIGSIYTHMEDFYKVEEWMTRATVRSIEEGNDVPLYWRVQLWQAYRQLAEELMDSPTERDSYLQKALALSRFLVDQDIEEKEHWARLSSDFAQIEEVSGTADGDYGGKAFYTIEAAYHFGLWDTESEYKKVISSMQVKDASSRAVLVFEEGFDQEIIERNFDNLFKYGQALYSTANMAKAAEIYEEAVGYVEDGKVLHTLASLHQLLDNFDQCISFADRALSATENELGEGSVEQVKFIKGVCQFYNDELDESEMTMESLQEEIDTDTEHSTLKNLRESAGQYIDLINAERARIEYKEHVDELWSKYNESKRG